MKKYGLVLVIAIILLLAATASPAMAQGELTLTKTADKAEASPGDNVTYTYVITNSDNDTISDITLEDNNLGGITLPQTSLDPGASINATASYIVDFSDYPGPLVNIATATGTRANSDNVTDNATAQVALIPVESSLDLIKIADVSSASPGDTIFYSFTVNNTGETNISNLVLKDNLLGDITLNSTSLDPGESTTAIDSYLVTASDLPGPIVNTANVTGTDPLGEPILAVSQEVSVALTYEAALELIKTADTASAVPGDNVTYTYTINNNSDVTISNLVLKDDMLGTIGLGETSIIPGDNITATSSYLVTASDLPGPIVNTANVTGTDTLGKPVLAVSQEVSVALTYNASLEVIKTADTASAAPHETINYTYVINNNGNVPISSLVLEDDRLGLIGLSETSLDPGDSTKATSSYEVMLGDLPGPIVNTANVTGTDSQGEAVSAASAAVSVQLIIKKEILTKAEILKMSGVPGKGIDTAPGLQKSFNPNSSAAENAGKKEKNEEQNQEQNQEQNSNKNKEKNKEKNKD